MILTPAIKGQLTRIVNLSKQRQSSRKSLHNEIYGFFVVKGKMPHAQAKHAARKYLAHA